MAKVLAKHHTSPLNQGGWACYAPECTFKDGTFKQAMEHQEAELAAAGYGNVREACAVGWDAAVGQMVYADGTPVEVAENINPWRDE